jgi:hypothetical protein
MLISVIQAIRRLQFILLKIALTLGVQFYDKIYYKDLKEPQDGKGWRAIFEPQDHILNDFEFDVIIGASGKQKCLPGKFKLMATYLISEF